MTATVLSFIRKDDKPPVEGATRVIINGKRAGWLMPPVTVEPIYRKYRSAK